MWTVLTTKENDNVTKYHIMTKDKTLSFREVIDLLTNVLSFRQLFIDTLKTVHIKVIFGKSNPLLCPH